MATAKRPASREEFEALRSRLAGLSHDEKVGLAAKTRPVAEKRGEVAISKDEENNNRAPTTDDELHAAILRETGFNIPRVAVCEDHCAPFDLIADGFFHRVAGIINLKSREAGGTLNASILQYTLCKYVPGHEGVQFGAIRDQAEKAFSYVKRFTEERVKKPDGTFTKRIKPEIDGEPLQKRIAWLCGSLLQIIVGTVSGVNSPHPNTVHADEVDLMEQTVIDQSNNMAQPLDCRVVTPDGWTTMGQIQVGDEVSGIDGPRKVLKTVDLGEQEVFEVTLSDGRKTRCASGHKWLVGYRSTRSELRWEVKAIEEILIDYRRFRAGGRFRKYRYFLPIPGPTDYRQSAPLPIDPYVLGVLLGDGCIRRRLVNFRAEDREIVKLVRDALPSGLDAYESSHNDGPSIYRITRGLAGKAARTPNPVVAALEELGLEGCNSHTKFIPDRYLYGSRNDRMALLRGLMDTDGCARPDPHFASVSVALAEGMVHLVRSLGGVARISMQKTAKNSYKNCGYIYIVRLALPAGTIPFRTSQKVNRFRPRSVRTLMPTIRDVSRLPREEEVRCITVDAEDGLYLTDDFIPTHNSSSTLLPDGTRIPALDVVVSTRKSMHGPMQKLIAEVEDAKSKGYEASYEIYVNCVFEVAEEVPCCRRVDPEVRAARLTELCQDPYLLCDCDRVVKGEWAKDEPRTLESVCRGKFFRSRGWMAHEDVKRKFRKNSQTVWEAEMECRRPMADGLYLPGWSRARFTTVGWQPRPELGKNWLAVDWGGSAESAIIWFQGPLVVPVNIQGPSGPVIVPVNSYVIFDELLKADIGAGKLGDMVVAKEIAWSRQIPGFRVTARFADMAGKQQRDDWREHKPSLPTSWYLPNRDFDPTVKTLQDLVGDQRYWVDSRCSRHMDDIEAWRQKAGKEVHDESSHTMASARYGLSNTEVLERRKTHRSSSSAALPVVVARAQDASLAAVVSGGGDPFSDERAWRSRLGENFDQNRPFGR